MWYCTRYQFWFSPSCSKAPWIGILNAKLFCSSVIYLSCPAVSTIRSWNNLKFYWGELISEFVNYKYKFWHFRISETIKHQRSHLFSCKSLRLSEISGKLLDGWRASGMPLLLMKVHVRFLKRFTLVGSRVCRTRHSTNKGTNWRKV